MKTTLLQISEAIDESNDEFGGARKFQLSNSTARTKREASEYSFVEFDLAVKVQTTGKSKKGGGLKVAVFDAKAGHEKEQIDSNTSRIKFVVMDNH